MTNNWLARQVEEYLAQRGTLAQRAEVIRRVYRTLGYHGVEALGWATGKTTEQLRAEAKLFFQQLRPSKRHWPNWRPRYD